MATKQTILFPGSDVNSGWHNNNFKGQSYKDKSTIIVCPTRGKIDSIVVSSWIGLMRPMNQKVYGPIFFREYEVGAAYEAAIDAILSHPELKKWKYLLTIEEDNVLPADALIKLIDTLEEGKFDAVGGLYFTKGIGGQPMCYGPTEVQPRNFVPFLPNPDSVQPCNGLGMGCTLFKMSMFKSGKITKPYFKTEQAVTDAGVRCYTQDLRFFELAGQVGYKFACDSRVKVGHYCEEDGQVW